MAYTFSLQGRSRRAVPLWLLTLLTLVLVGGWLGWNAYSDYNTTVSYEYSSLEVGARNRGVQISGLVRSVELMLENLEEDLNCGENQTSDQLNLLLKARLRQLPESRGMMVTDRNGILIGLTITSEIGFDASKRGYFIYLRDLENSHTHNDKHRCLLRHLSRLQAVSWAFPSRVRFMTGAVISMVLLLSVSA